MAEPQVLLTVDEAARRCGVTRRTLYHWMRRGLIRWYVLPSGARRIVAEDLLRYPPSDTLPPLDKEFGNVAGVL